MDNQNQIQLVAAPMSAWDKAKAWFILHSVIVSSFVHAAAFKTYILPFFFDKK